MEKSRDIVPGGMVYLYLWFHQSFTFMHGLVGWVWSKYRLIATASVAFTCWRPISPHRRIVNRHETMWYVTVTICRYRWTKNHKGSSNSLTVLKERIIKLPALTTGHWHHLVISFMQPKLSAEEQKDLEGDSVPSSKVGVIKSIFWSIIAWSLQAVLEAAFRLFWAFQLYLSDVLRNPKMPQPGHNAERCTSIF